MSQSLQTCWSPKKDCDAHFHGGTALLSQVGKRGGELDSEGFADPILATDLPKAKPGLSPQPFDLCLAEVQSRGR